MKNMRSFIYFFSGFWTLFILLIFIKVCKAIKEIIASYAMKGLGKGRNEPRSHWISKVNKCHSSETGLFPNRFLVGSYTGICMLKLNICYILCYKTL